LVYEAHPLYFVFAGGDISLALFGRPIQRFISFDSFLPLDSFRGSLFRLGILYFSAQSAVRMALCGHPYDPAHFAATASLFCYTSMSCTWFNKSLQATRDGRSSRYRGGRHQPRVPELWTLGGETGFPKTNKHIITNNIESQ
jgi:hypothetical protein